VSFLTLVVAVTGPESIWLLADRRLSYERGPPKDDGHKIMFLEATDGVAILGYAGLGATARGTEPADWMSAVLRGRNLPLEQSLRALAEATKSQLPSHIARVPGVGSVAHNVIVPAFLGNEPRLYSIDLVLSPDRKSHQFRYTRHVANEPSAAAPPSTHRFALGGSGARHVMRDRQWMRNLLRILKANDRRKVSPLAIADYLAKRNNEVHQADKSVGPRCIVAWRFRKGGVHGGGGGHQFYSGQQRDSSSPSLPSIANGMVVNNLVEVLMPHMRDMWTAMLAGEPIPEPDSDEINAALARLPHEPDEDLR